MKKFRLKGIVKDLPTCIPCAAITCVATPCVAIPYLTHGKLHEMCIFHTMRKRGPCKHIKGLHCSFVMADTCEVIIEWYRS